jgi:hypothetical protein
VLPQPPRCRAIVGYGGLPGDVLRRVLLFKHLTGLGIHAPTAREQLANSHNRYLHLEVLTEERGADLMGQAQDEPRLLAADAQQRRRQAPLRVAAKVCLAPQIRIWDAHPVVREL